MPGVDDGPGSRFVDRISQSIYETCSPFLDSLFVSVNPATEGAPSRARVGVQLASPQ